MAQEIIGRMVPNLQELFDQQDGLKRFLEAVIEQAMSAEVAEHLGAERHERSIRTKRGHPPI